MNRIHDDLVGQMTSTISASALDDPLWSRAASA